MCVRLVWWPLEHKSSSIFRFRRKPSTKWCPRRALFWGSCFTGGPCSFLELSPFFVGGMGLSRHFGVWNVILHDRCRTSETFSSVWQAWYFLERWFRRSFVNLDVRFRTHDDLRGRRGASNALGPFVVAVETSTKKYPKPGSNIVFTFSMFIVCDVRDIDWTSNICSGNPLVTLCVSDRSGCGAVLSLRSHAAYYRSLLVTLRNFVRVFWLGNVLRATTACTFWTSQLPKVVREWCVLYILTSKCASRHNGVHFFDIATSKSGPNLPSRELVQRPCVEISCRDLAKGFLRRGLAKRSLVETSCTEILCRGLSGRPCAEIL